MNKTKRETERERKNHDVVACAVKYIDELPFHQGPVTLPCSSRGAVKTGRDKVLR